VVDPTPALVAKPLLPEALRWGHCRCRLNSTVTVVVMFWVAAIGESAGGGELLRIPQPMLGMAGSDGN